jgi:hypothetical protein
MFASISIFCRKLEWLEFLLNFLDFVEIFMPRSMVGVSCILPFNLVKVLKSFGGLAADKLGNLAETVLLWSWICLLVGGVIHIGNFCLFLRLGTAPPFGEELGLALLLLWRLVCGWSWVGGRLGGLGFVSDLLLANQANSVKVGGLGWLGRLADVSPS